jgi:hypothetical protein
VTRVVALCLNPILRIGGVVNLIDRVRTVEFALLCIIGAHNVAWCASVTFASQIIARQAVLAARQAVARIGVCTSGARTITCAVPCAVACAVVCIVWFTSLGRVVHPYNLVKLRTHATIRLMRHVVCHTAH